MTAKKVSKKRVTITFQPEPDVLQMLEKLKIHKRERSRIINQALKEKGAEVAKRLEKSKRVFEGAPEDNNEGTR
jgi:hypothetical protein